MLINHHTSSRKGQTTLATINEKGSFTAQFKESQAGLVPGDYRISIMSHKVPLDKIPPAQLARMGDTNLAIPKKYTHAAQSGLTVSVADKDRSKHLELKLED